MVLVERHMHRGVGEEEPRRDSVVARYRMATRKRLVGWEADLVVGHWEARHKKVMPRW